MMESQSLSDHGGEPIAIVGSGCRFPGGASSPSKLWALLREPCDLLTEIPLSRFNPHAFYHPDGAYHAHSNVTHSYMLTEDHRVFDADFFNISANEANAIDPQQRLLMETVYEALENGGHTIKSLIGSDTAVYVGLMCEEYGVMQMRDLNCLPTYFPTGTARSIVSNRISYFFDWRGPCMTIDTACSSSLVAVHQAAQVLRSGVSRVAIAAGTNLILGPEAYISESTFHMLSPHGRSHMWDSRADGYGRGEGVAAVVLKRLSDAIADGDAIECIIRETGVNQDGRTKGITVPRADAQISLIRDTYRRAGLDLKTAQGRPQFFEAHGTGTPAGDPVEAEAINRAIAGQMGCGGEKLWVGSIKSVIGHTEGTAGIAGLLKISLALQHKTIPPNLLFENLAPAIKPFYTNVEVPVKAVDWPMTPPGQPRRASLNRQANLDRMSKVKDTNRHNSFGFGGTNAHAIVESFDLPFRSNSPTAVKLERSATEIQPFQLRIPFNFSALSISSLKKTVSEFSTLLERPLDNMQLYDLSYTLASRRSVFSHRISFSGSGTEEVRQGVNAWLADPNSQSAAVTKYSEPSVQILGIFTGQGAQWAGMGKELIRASPFVKGRVKGLDAILAALPEEERPSWSLVDEILAEGSDSKLATASVSQPVCTALQLVQIDLLRAAGIRFSAVVGHSSGEIAAAYASGAIDDAHAITIAYYRGLYSGLARASSGEPGSMMAISTTIEDAEQLISLPEVQGRLSIAARNSPTSLTLSGDASAIKEVGAVFEDEGKFARLLRVDTAYHSHHMLPCADPYLKSLQRSGIAVSKTRDGCKWYSSVDNGSLITDEKKGLDAEYWCRNMTQPVLFMEAIQKAAESTKFTLLVEVGPHSALKGPVNDTISALEGSTSLPYISALLRNKDSIECMTEALGFVWTHSPEGAVDFPSFHECVFKGSDTYFKPSLVRDLLPAYQWDHERAFWAESRRSRAMRMRPAPGHPLLGTLSPESTPRGDLVWQNVLRLSELPWLSGHRLQGQVVFPAAGYVSLAVESAVHVAGQRHTKMIEIQDLTIARAVVLDEGDNTGVETSFHLHIKRETDTQVDGTFYFHAAVSRDPDLGPPVASGRLRLSFGGGAPSPLLPPRAPEMPRMTDVDEKEFYTELAKLGYEYTASFRALSNMKRKLGAGRGLVRRPSLDDMHLSERQLLIHPGFLDAAFQAIFLAYTWPGDGSLWALHVPTSIGCVRIDPTTLLPPSGNTTGPTVMAFDSTVRRFDRAAREATILGCVGVYCADGNGAIQVEDLGVVPFSSTTAAQDTHVFFDNVLGVLDPDGSLALGGDRASEDEIERAWTLERISYYYLQRLVSVISPEEEARTEWYYQKLLAFARHVVEKMEDGMLTYADKEWKKDTPDVMQQVMAAYEHDMVEIRLMRAVGENLASAVRGETHMLQHMMKDGMLNQFYVDGLGIRPYTRFLTEIIAQITHRYPHMHVVEIGAGTGGATKMVTRRIKDEFDSYTFTDISSGFFETAQQVFSELSERMVFRVLDIEKDVVAQGFKEQHYDLAVASLVLHATRDLHVTLRNARKLLKPGGYLVMLEVTSNDVTRTSFTMGGLPGWWLGADNGRPWSPCVTAVEWHELLLQSGFSGVQTNTPEYDILARPFGVLVSRAVDDRMSLLLEPSIDVSPVSSLRDVIVLTGTKLPTIRLAQNTVSLLQKHCKSVTTVKSLEEVAAIGNLSSTHVSVLSLIELEQPIFRTLKPRGFSGLQRLFMLAQNVVWLTRGAARSEPHANLTVGLGRALKMEMPHLQVRFLDFDDGADPAANYLADELLRLQILGEVGSVSENVLWSQEMEARVDVAGREWIPRIKPNKRWNDHYNSSRREVIARVNPATEPITIYEKSLKMPLKYWMASSMSSSHPYPPATATEGLVKIRAEYVAASAVPISAGVRHYLVAGLNLATNARVVTLADSISSIVHVPKHTMVPFEVPDGLSPTECLSAISAYLLSAHIVNSARNNSSILVVNASTAFAEMLRALATQINPTVKAVFATSHSSMQSSVVTYIHPFSSPEALKAHLPRDVSLVAHFDNISSFAQRIVCLFAKPVKIVDAHGFEATSTFTNTETDHVSAILRDALALLVAGGISHSAVKASAPAVLTAEDFVKSPQKGVVIDWLATAGKGIPVPLLQSDSVPLCRPDRTYILFGLGGAGGLGLSLAEWMVAQGAKYIILTSRNPRPDPEWTASYASQGVRIELMLNDVTDPQAVSSMIEDIRRSWPPIAGVANGAMVLHDTAFEAMTYDQLVKVLRPKVDGTRILDELFFHEPLEFFILFSSLSSVFGNSGQSNYAASNMYEIAVCAQRRQRRVAASVMDIGAIMGVGYMAREVGQSVLSQLVDAGYRKMSERDFHLAFANAILAGRVGSGQPEELIMGLSSVSPDNSLKLTWTQNPRFSHVVGRASDTLNQAVNRGVGVVSPKELLKSADSSEQVARVVRDSVVAKLKLALQLQTDDPDSLLAQTADGLGVDSLVAVELRSWFLREMNVSIPVLKILGGGTMAELVEYAIECLPAESVPELDPAATAAMVSHSRPITSSKGTSVSALSSTHTHATTLNTVDASSSDLPFSRSGSESRKQLEAQSTDMQMNIVQDQGPQIIKSIPMSFGQSRFWFMREFVTDPSAFNVVGSFHIAGLLNIPSLTLAVRTLGQRHESLRTSFLQSKDTAERPMQRVLSETRLHLKTKPISTDGDFRQEFHQMKHHKFDLERGESMRILLLSRSPREHHLIISYHHINMDGVSLGVLMSDLQRLYVGQTLLPPALQYTDFSQNQIQRLRLGFFRTEIEFWRGEFQTLPDVLPILNLSVRSLHHRSVLASYNHVVFESRMPLQLASKIRPVCRKIGITPFHLYCTVLGVLLSRLSCSQDVCIGVADANRSESGAMEAIGNFLNLFPVRLQVVSDQPLSSIARQVKQKALRGMANSAVPFETLLDELNVPRDATHSPLFQAFIDYRVVNEKAYLGDAEIEAEEYSISETPYDVMVDIVDNPLGTASVSILLQKSLYTVEDAQTMWECYLNLLEAFVEDPESPIGKPQMFNRSRVENALKLGQGPEMDLPDTGLLTDITAMISANVDLTALKGVTDNVVSYEEMGRRAFAISRALRAIPGSIGKGSRVAILQEPTTDWVCSLLGIWRIGATFVPLELDQGIERLRSIVQHANISAIIVLADTSLLLGEIGWSKVNATVNLSDLDMPITAAALTDDGSATGNDEAMVLYTSGSTGVPKGISLPHRMIRATIQGYLQSWPWGPQTVLQHTALSFDHAWQEALIGLASGGSVVIAPRSARRDPLELTGIIASKGVTLTTTVPSQSSAWLQYGDLDKLRHSKLSWLLSGGEPMSSHVIQLFQSFGKPDLRLLNIYGPTEVMVPTMHEVRYRTMTAADMPIPIGAVRPSYQAYVVDGLGHPVPAGVPGELIVAGAGVALGYVDDAAKTAEKFISNQFAPQNTPQKAWSVAHRTGDRVYLRQSDGVFVLLGRNIGDTQIKIRGQRLDVREVETCIVKASRGDIINAVVHLRSTPEETSGRPGSEFLVAHLALASAAIARLGSDGRSGDRIQEFLTTVTSNLPLPSYMRPSILIPLEAFPLNIHGKIDRLAISNLALGSADRQPTASKAYGRSENLSELQTENCQKLKDIWVDVLGGAAMPHIIGAASDFFFVGGNSILLIGVQREIQRRYGRSIPLMQLFQASTLGQMAELLGQENYASSEMATATTSPKIDWNSETEVDSDILGMHFDQSRPEARPDAGLVIAITGATGFLGRHLLKVLVASPRVRIVHCLAVRDPQKLDSEALCEKVIVHQGDLGVPFGSPEVQSVFGEADIIIHNAADVSFLKAYSTVRRVNIDSTKEIVRLALRYGAVRRLHFVSTAGIAALNQQVLDEKPLLSHPPEGSSNGYVLSKWACENYLENVAGATGLPITIHRPTAIIGPDAPRLDVMHNVLHFAEQLRFVPEMKALEGWFQFVGIDHITQDMVQDIVASTKIRDVGHHGVVYRNHCGTDESAVEIHDLGSFLSKKYGVDFVVIDDYEWVEKATAAGLALEIGEYLQTIDKQYQAGVKWVFPKVLKRNELELPEQ